MFESKKLENSLKKATTNNPALQIVSASSKLLEFKNVTTSHGIPHIARARGIKKVLWLFCTFICLGALIYNFYQLVDKFLKYEVNVSIYIKNRKSMNFPAVTICNSNPILKQEVEKQNKFKKMFNNFEKIYSSYDCSYKSTLFPNSSSVVNYTTSSPKPFNYSSTQSTSFSTTTTSNIIGPSQGCMPSSGFTGDGDPMRFDYWFENQVLEELSELDDEKKRNMGHQLYSLIYDCSFAGVTCNMTSNFKTFFNNFHGNCYVFNSAMYSGENTTIKKSKKPGPKHGLSIVFNLEQDNYMADFSHSAGLRVVVHDNQRMPFPEDEGVLVSPSALTYIGVTLTETTSLGGYYGDCINSSENKSFKTLYERKYNVLYDEKSCDYSLLNEKIKKECQCADITFPKDVNCNMTMCSSKNNTQTECMFKVWQEYENDTGAFSTFCRPACHEKYYETTISKESWPSSEYMKKLSQGSYDSIFRNINFSSENFGKVTIFIENFRVTSLLETPAYEKEELASDIGGVFGLYIGLSILSIMEFIELGFDLSAIGFRKIITCCKKMNPKVSQEPTEKTETGKEDSPPQQEENKQSNYEKFF